MLYVLSGTKKEKAREKTKELIEALQKKRPDAEVFRMHAENWNPGELEAHVGGMGLFSQKYIIFLDSLFEIKEAKDILLEKAKELQSSENIFIILEGEIDVKSKKKLEVAERALTFDIEIKKKEEFKIFALADALGMRNKKKLWVLYRKAKNEGMEDEPIHGTIFWQIKSLLLASESGSAKEAGLNPFVFSKARSFSKNFSKEELKHISSNLVSLYHDSRRGIHELDNALEKFVLEI